MKYYLVYYNNTPPVVKECFDVFTEEHYYNLFNTEKYSRNYENIIKDLTEVKVAIINENHVIIEECDDIPSYIKKSIIKYKRNSNIKDILK